MKASQEEVRENWLLWPQREAEIFFMLENNKIFEIPCCLLLTYLVKKDLIDKQECGNKKSDIHYSPILRATGLRMLKCWVTIKA